MLGTYLIITNLHKRCDKAASINISGTVPSSIPFWLRQVSLQRFHAAVYIIIINQWIHI